MAIPFLSIYTKAVGLFDDPQITTAYETNKIQFCKLMYSYLQNSISRFSNPSYIGYLLTQYTEPVGQMEVWKSNGSTTSFVLNSDFLIMDGSLYNYVEDGSYVNGVLDVSNRTVTFPDALGIEGEYSFEQYFPGEFINNFEGVASTAVANNNAISQIKDILARLLVLSWAENERNFLLDVSNLMTGSDFKISSNSKILTAKIQWLDQLLSEVSMLQNRLSWGIRFAKNAGWGQI